MPVDFLSFSLYSIVVDKDRTKIYILLNSEWIDSRMQACV